MLHDIDPDELAAAVLSAQEFVNSSSKPKPTNPKCRRKPDGPKYSVAMVRLAMDTTKNGYRKKSRSILRKWESSGTIPTKALEHLLQFFPDIVQRVPVLKNQVSSLIQLPSPMDLDQIDPTSATPQILSPLPPYHVSRTNPQGHTPVQPFADLADLSSQVWEESQNVPFTPKTLQEILGDETVSFLMGTNRKSTDKITFQRILMHWAVECNIPLDHLTTFLKLIKKFQATLTVDDIDRLPSTGKTLLKLTAFDKGQVSSSPVVDGGGKHLGTYMHYGVEAGVLGYSPGLVEKVKHKELLRRVHLLHPNIFPPKVLHAIRPSADEVGGFVGSFTDPEIWESTPATAKSVVFRIQASSDGVTPFKTDDSSVRCIMGSLDSVYSPELGVTVPIPDSPPFMIGIYKGEAKNSDLVLKTVVDEFVRLKPNNSDREVFCELTTWVADAVERSAICGTLGSAGKVSCPRCTQIGTQALSAWQLVNVPLSKQCSISNHMYFPSLTFILREDALWASYLVDTRNGVPQPYRKRPHVEIERILEGKMVSAIPIESMHSVAGGTCKDFINRIREPKIRGGYGFLSAKGKRIVEERIVQMRKSVISEPARYIRSLEKFKEFKMREIHVMFHYYLYPMFYYAVEELHDGEKVLDTLKAKLLALHLTKGFSTKAVPPKDLEDAKALLQNYVVGCMQIFGEQWATPKNHWLLHILEDCQNHGCHLERLATWKYENKYGDLRRNLRHGDKTLEQIRNRSCEKKKYLLELTDDGAEVKDFSLAPRAVACMRATGSIELPPAFVHSVKRSPRSAHGKIMNCEGFRLTNTFPNNICLLSSKRVMFIIDLVHEVDEKDPLLDKFFLIGFIFRKVEPAFMVPQSSSRIGFFRCSQLDACKLQTFNANMLESKCFIFPRGVSSDRPQPRVNPVSDSVDELLRSYVVAESEHQQDIVEDIRSEWIRFKVIDPSFGSDYWWVQSLVVPGRFPNFHF